MRSARARYLSFVPERRTRIVHARPTAAPVSARSGAHPPRPRIDATVSGARWLSEGDPDENLGRSRSAATQVLPCSRIEEFWAVPVRAGSSNSLPV